MLLTHVEQLIEPILPSGIVKMNLVSSTQTRRFFKGSGRYK